MGMSIDKTIEFFNGLECHTPQAKDARDVVIKTMHKYQKIQQILKSLDDGEINYPQMTYYLREVLEDGNVD